MTYQKKPTGPFSMTEELRSALQIWGRATEGDEDADDVVTEALNRISQPVAAQQHAQVDIVDLMPKRAAFISWVESRSIDASIEKDSWGARIFKHPHVQSMWEGWFNAPTESACTKQHAQAAKAVEVAGLGSITNEDDGVLTLRFKDEDSASNFMLMHLPTVDCRDMPRTNLVEDNSRVTCNAQAAQDRGAETADIEPKSAISPLGKGGRGGAEAALSDKEIDLIMVTNGFPNTRPTAAFRSFARAILAASQQPAAVPSAPAEQALRERGDPLVVLTLGGIDGEEYGEWDIEVFSSRAIDEMQARLVHTDEPVILNLYADGVDFAAPAIQVQEGATQIDALKVALDALDRSEPMYSRAFLPHQRKEQHAAAMEQVRAALAAAPAPVQPAPVAYSLARIEMRAQGVHIATHAKIGGGKRWALHNAHSYLRALTDFEEELIDCSITAFRTLAAKPSEAV